MEKVELLKKVDKLLGTPIGGMLGAFNEFVSRKSASVLASQRILIIKLVAIGDLVLCLPTVRAIRKSFGSSHIAMLVTPRVREVVEGCPYLDETIYYDILGEDKGIKGLLKIIRQLRKRKFDLIIELEQYYRITTLIAYFSGVKNRVGFDLPGQGRRGLYTIRVPYLIDKHEVEAFLEAAKKVGANISDKELVEIWVSPEDKEYVTKFLTGAGVTEDDFLVGIHPGTGPSAISRRWAPEKFAKLTDWLIKECKAKVIFTGAPSELNLINNILRSTSTYPIISAGKTNLKQMAEIAKRCKLFISVDTGPLHIAAAMKTKVIGLFGPNTPLKWGPYGNGHITIYKKLDCSPCTKQYLGQVSNCTDPVCMKEITVEDVKTAVLQMLHTHPN
jgi:heptosyltransferase-2